MIKFTFDVTGLSNSPTYTTFPAGLSEVQYVDRNDNDALNPTRFTVPSIGYASVDSVCPTSIPVL